MNNIKLLNYLLGKLPAGSGFILSRQTREWRPSSHPTPCWNVNKCLSQKLLNYSFNYLYTLHTIKHTHGDTLVRSRVSLLKSTTDHKAHTGPLSLSLSLSRRSDVSPLGCLKSYTWLNWQLNCKFCIYGTIVLHQVQDVYFIAWVLFLLCKRFVTSGH